MSTETIAAPPQTRPELDEVLREINRIRTDRGADPIYELPCGQRGNAGRCPLANALADLAEHATVWKNVVLQTPSREHTFPTPPAMRVFAVGFDNGQYPELIA